MRHGDLARSFQFEENCYKSRGAPISAITVFLLSHLFYTILKTNYSIFCTKINLRFQWKYPILGPLSSICVLQVVSVPTSVSSAGGKNSQSISSKFTTSII